MKVTKQETLYHEDYGATLKHKCGKRIVTVSLLSFFYPHLGQCSKNDDHHTFIFLTTQQLQLDT